MDDADELEAALVDAGFSRYEAEAYLGLLRLRDASVSELTEVCSVPRSRLYDVLRNLEEGGYVETYEQDTLRARIANVSSVVEELRTRATDLSEAAEGLEDRWERPQFQTTDISVFQTYTAAVSEAVELVEDADYVVQVCASPGEILEIGDALERAVDRGVTVRLSVTDDPDAAVSDDLPDLFPDITTEVRQCEATMPFVALVDGFVVVFAVSNKWDGEYGLVVDDTTLSSIAHWFFQIQLWEPWDTLYSTAIGRPTTYTSVRELIRDIETLHSDDETVLVRVEGIDMRRHQAIEIEGEIVGVDYTDVYGDRDATFANQFIRATLRVRTDDDEYTVGGYGAVVEDVRAVQVTIVDIA